MLHGRKILVQCLLASPVLLYLPIDSQNHIDWSQGAEGRSPETFLEKCLIDTFGREKFSSTFVVERARRIPLTPGPPGSPPRTFIAKLLNFRDRDAVLQLTRELGHLTIQNATISVYPDFSVNIQKGRAKFIVAKRKLHELSIKYSMLYLSKPI